MHYYRVYFEDFLSLLNNRKHSCLALGGEMFQIIM